MPSPRIKTKDASHRFLRLVTEYITRVITISLPLTGCETIRLNVTSNFPYQAERISVETGCWLFVAAQHTTARLPFIHYSSPRLRRDGSKSLEDAVNQFSKMFSGLVAARRLEAQEMHDRMLESQAEAKKSQEELALAVETQQAVQAKADEAQELCLRQQSDIERQQELIAQYQLQLANLNKTA